MFNLAGCSTCRTKQQQTVILTCLVSLDSYNTLLHNNTKQVAICPNIEELWLHYKAHLLENYIFTYLSGLYRGESCFYFNFLHNECFWIESYCLLIHKGKYPFKSFIKMFYIFRMHFCCIHCIQAYMHNFL